MANNAIASISGGQAAAIAKQGADQASSKDRSRDLSERFLTLLVAQMKNQDPLKPTDNSEITSQIAQINTVTGINDLNDRLGKITGQIDTSQQLQASSLIGKKVLVPDDRVKVGKDGEALPFGVDLSANAAKLQITLTDDAGNVVHRSEYTNQPAGVQSFDWNGHDASDAVADPGSYHLNVKATDAEGQPVNVQPLSTGYVDGVVSGDAGPRLDLGPNGLVSLDDVYQIL